MVSRLRASHSGIIFNADWIIVQSCSKLVLVRLSCLFRWDRKGEGEERWEEEEREREKKTQPRVDGCRMYWFAVDLVVRAPGEMTSYKWEKQEEYSRVTHASITEKCINLGGKRRKMTLINRKRKKRWKKETRKKKEKEKGRGEREKRKGKSFSGLAM